MACFMAGMDSILFHQHLSREEGLEYFVIDEARASYGYPFILLSFVYLATVAACREGGEQIKV